MVDVPQADAVELLLARGTTSSCRRRYRKRLEKEFRSLAQFEAFALTLVIGHNVNTRRVQNDSI